MNVQKKRENKKIRKKIVKFQKYTKKTELKYCKYLQIKYWNLNIASKNMATVICHRSLQLIGEHKHIV